MKVLCDDFKEVGIITSKGDSVGTLKLAKYQDTLNEYSNLNIHQLPSIKIGYSGETRSTNFFLYPKSINIITKYDVIVFEGTTNLLNNIYLVPLAKLFNKKTIWWDAGYSLPIRSFKRKLIDLIVAPFIRCTDGQMGYSTLAKNYLENHMGANKVFLNLNTINTSYFESISAEINESVNSYKFDESNIKLLYVGVVEERKKVKQLIDIVTKLNSGNIEKQFSLTVIGGGNQLEELKLYVEDNDKIKVLGPIYDKSQLKMFYFESDLFILPGDGGLAILQSLLFGLPVLSVIGADGTELDYIKDKSFLVNGTDKIEDALRKLPPINRTRIFSSLPNIKHVDWNNVLEDFIKKL
ncbi:glycosyltransferase [Pseudalgibacter alginicilyticus]|uniref:glycosyltransferase n=1 Tax=Pseudalgibacter alginicilyticus TaxID=1736674 RepID=UPI0012FE4F62|nr:glycosyltransferase [Pseudalgibacter alginicilyticus]